MADVTTHHPALTGSRFRRVRATSRSAGAVEYVCRVGWTTPVHRLEGSAAAVWRALALHDTVEALASSLDVDADDRLLIAALDLLVQAGLVEPDTP